MIEMPRTVQKRAACPDEPRNCPPDGDIKRACGAKLPDKVSVNCCHVLVVLLRFPLVVLLSSADGLLHIFPCFLYLFNITIILFQGHTGRFCVRFRFNSKHLARNVLFTAKPAHRTFKLPHGAGNLLDVFHIYAQLAVSVFCPSRCHTTN